MPTRQVTGRAHERGVTLVEVLVAVTVLAVALIAIFRALDGQTRSTGALAERMFAHWAALNALEEARLPGAHDPSRESEETVNLGGIEWKVIVRREAGPYGLTRLAVETTAEGRAGAILVGFLPEEEEP